MVILFDGVCNMCNSFVQFVIKRDKNKLFQFASLQSEYGKGLLKHFHLDTREYDTMLLYDGQKVLTRSDAVLAVTSRLKGIWKWSSFCKMVPGFLRNGIYTMLAKRRYKLFGKRETCMVPTPELKSRFLDDTQFS